MAYCALAFGVRDALNEIHGKPSDIASEISDAADRVWNAEAHRYMQSSNAEHLHLSVVVRDHFALVNELKSSVDPLFARNMTESEWDYYQIEDSHKRILRRQCAKVLVGQVGKGKDPHDQLYRFFDTESLREILRHPRHSKEQVGN